MQLVVQKLHLLNTFEALQALTILAVKGLISTAVLHFIKIINILRIDLLFVR